MNVHQLPRYSVACVEKLTGWARCDTGAFMYYMVSGEWQLTVWHGGEQWMCVIGDHGDEEPVDGVRTTEEAMAVALATWRMG
jgi:hypothetical protein